MLSAVQCPVCSGSTSVSVTKSRTGVKQYSLTCPIHGRLSQRWYTSAANAAAATLIKSGKLKWYAPI